MNKQNGSRAWRKFKRNKVAVAGGVVLAIILFLTLFSEFISPYNYAEHHYEFAYLPPQRIRFIDENGHSTWPFVYGVKRVLDPESFAWQYQININEIYYIRLFARGETYKFWGLFETDVHLFGTDPKEGPLFLLGTDSLGRDLFSRILSGGRISLSIGLLGTVLTMLLAVTLGSISGYYGGKVDMIIQRSGELLMSFPRLPLWMALAAARPPTFAPTQVYIGIVIIMSLIGWPGFGREIRAIVLSFRDSDFVIAARAVGSNDGRIILKHILPSVLYYSIVGATLTMPLMILGESTLSFLGIGIKPPMTSWGVLLQQAQNIHTLVLYPWLLTPGLFIVLAILAFNFIGDGLRDAVNPFSQ
jgi:peptide/nickel transport system permease protein